MSVVPLFVTADIDTKVIDELVTQSCRPKSGGSRLWLLIRSPSGPSSVLTRVNKWWPGEDPDRPDSSPVEPFETGFRDASPRSLQKFVREQDIIEHDRSIPEWERENTSRSMFAVLDSKSASDKTVLVYHYHRRMPKEALQKDESAYDRELLIHEWVEWRVRFLDAAFWTAQYWFSSDYNDFQITKDQYIDDKGVLQIPWLEHSETEFPGLPDDEKAPWGPEKEKQEYQFPESVWLEHVESGLIKVYPVSKEDSS